MGVCLSGHVIGFAVELTSRDPLTAKVKEVDCDHALLLSATSTLKARAAAEYCLAGILRRLGLAPVTREPQEADGPAGTLLRLIAVAQEGEDAAYGAATDARQLLPEGVRPHIYGTSRAVTLLESYIDSVIDAVQAEQEDRAEAEAAEQGVHASP